MNLLVNENLKKNIMPYVLMTFGMLPLMFVNSREPNLNYVLNNLAMLLGSLVMFYIVNTMKFNETRREILASKKLLIPFLFTFGIHIIFIYTSQYTSVYTKAISWLVNNLRNIGINVINYDYLTFLLLLVSLSSIYLVGVKFSNFNWRISKKELKSILIIIVGKYLPLILVCIFMYKTFPFIMPQISSVDLFILTIRTLLYPALYEEFIYRGILISLLKSYNISFNKINIIQALLFGFIHFSNIGNHFSIFSFLLTGFQIVTGYILGLVYYKTKSLTPCILLHALINLSTYFIK